MTTDNDSLMHYGVLRRSGRYPWGSGNTPYERSRGFLGAVDELKKKGLSSKEIVEGLGLESTTQLRDLQAIAKNEVRKADAAQALRLKEKNMSNVAIGKRMGISESSVRSLLDPALADKAKIIENTANMLKEQIGDGYLDVGRGSEKHIDVAGLGDEANLGISSTRLRAALTKLKEEGYVVIPVQTPQLTGSGGKTTVKVLAPPGTTYTDVVKNMDKIKLPGFYSEDGGRSMETIKPPINVSSDRVGVRYAEEGGKDADGVIYLRRGVDDISLGSSRYAQVRIAVDGTHYLKGMAMYSDNMPAGVDLLFNTNKSSTGNKLDALKSIKEDPENPFGAVTRQRHYIDAEGNRKQSALNIVNAEGDWRDWSKSLSSQMLSKQSPALIKRQLDLAYLSHKNELDEISKLTNPVVKEKLLQTFSDSADSAAVHLKAAALPNQGTHVILPISSLKENEIYAPNYRNGEKVVLVRFPHAGTFEIPELTVNNKNQEATNALGSKEGRPAAVDAVGIHPEVAKRLSGADFDGDTVLVIPNNRKDVKSSSPLEGLKDFDPQRAYPEYEGMKPMTAKAKQLQMGDVSNLITDMTIKGASNDELAAAVRHSMVVIDAEKHNLNYRQSYVDNGIASLKERYQGRGPSGRLSGASTLISRAGSTIQVPRRKLRRSSEGGPIDPVTGQKVWTYKDESWVDKNGRVHVPTVASKRLAETHDAFELIRGTPTPVEIIYAEHSNRLKALANEARKESLTTGKITKSPSAVETYAREVASLNAKLNLALKNQPKERQAQLIANSAVQARRRDNPAMDDDELKKIKGQQILIARARIGAKKPEIDITPEEWHAIQSGAITTTKLKNILDNADMDKVRQLATPRAALEMTPAKIAIAQARLASGYTQAEVAESLGVPVSTLNSALHRKEDNGKR